MTEGLTDDQRRGFRSGRGFVDQIFTQRQIGEKAREKKQRMYVGLVNLEKAYDKINTLKHTIQSQEHHNNIPYKHLTRWN